MHQDGKIAIAHIPVVDNVDIELVARAYYSVCTVRGEYDGLRIPATETSARMSLTSPTVSVFHLMRSNLSFNFSNTRSYLHCDISFLCSNLVFDMKINVD